MGKRLLILLLGMFLAVHCFKVAVQGAGEDKISHIDLKVFFKVCECDVDMSQFDNNKRLNDFISCMEKLKRDSLATFSRAVITGSASPEGYIDRNEGLAGKRAEALCSYLKSNVNLPDVTWSLESLGSNWEELKQKVLAMHSVYSGDIADIIDNTPIWIKKDGKIVGGRKQSLMNLGGGNAWHLMEKQIFPGHRYAELSLYYVTHLVDTNVVEMKTPTAVAKLEPDGVGPEPAGVVTEPAGVGTEPKESGTLFAFKTNLLYDAAIHPTLGVEVPFGNKFSISAEWTYAWWSSGTKPFCVKSYGGDAAFRWWPGQRGREDVLRGHHLGIYGQMFKCDYMLSQNAGIQSARWNYATGIEYGYSIKLSDSFHLDLGLGVGHVWGEYTTYRQINYKGEVRYPAMETKTYPVVFPTKAEVSLIWLIK